MSSDLEYLAAEKILRSLFIQTFVSGFFAKIKALQIKVCQAWTCSQSLCVGLKPEILSLQFNLCRRKLKAVVTEFLYQL